MSSKRRTGGWKRPWWNTRARSAFPICHVELWYGVEHSVHTDRNRAGLEHFLQRLDVQAFGREAGRHYGDIRQQLTLRGAPIGSNDLLIAARAKYGGNLGYQQRQGVLTRARSPGSQIGLDLRPTSHDRRRPESTLMLRTIGATLAVAAAEVRSARRSTRTWALAVGVPQPGQASTAAARKARQRDHGLRCARQRGHAPRKSWPRYPDSVRWRGRRGRLEQGRRVRPRARQRASDRHQPDRWRDRRGGRDSLVPRGRRIGFHARRSRSRSPAEGSLLARGSPSRSPADGSLLARGSPSRSPAEGSLP